MAGKQLTVEALRAYVTAAQEELRSASAFHEAWKPSAYDDALHRRLDNSYSAHTFRAIRLALRQEMLLSLMRMWDSRNSNLSMESISVTLHKKAIVDALFSSSQLPSDLIEGARREFQDVVDNTLLLIDSYRRGGGLEHVRDAMQRMRNEVIAHRDMAPTDASKILYDDDVDKFYNDNIIIIKNLMHIAHLTAYDPAEFAELIGRCAKLFWDGVKSERVEGHPSFRVRREVAQ